MAAPFWVWREFPLNFVRFTLRRVSGEATLLIGAFVGSLITATVIAGAPVYLRTLEQAGVEDTIESVSTTYQHLQINTSWLPLEAGKSVEANEVIAAAQEEYLDGAITGSTALIKTRRANWGKEGEGLRRHNEASRAMFLSVTGVNERIVYIVGQAPSGHVYYEDGIPTVEAALVWDRASRFDIRVGDVIDTVPEVRGIGLVKVHITGIFTVSDASDEFWVGLSDPIVRPLPIVDGRESPIVLLIEPSVMLDTIAEANAGLPANFGWHLFVNSDYFKELTLNEAIERLTDFEDRIAIEITRADVLTVLETRLQSLQRRMLFARIPMLLLAALAITSIAYYLFMVAGIIARRRAPETSRLRSRGITVLQVIRSYAIESVIIAGVPALIAPLIGIGLVATLGLLPAYRSVSDSLFLSVEFAWQSWIWSIGAGIAVFAILLLPAILGTRRGIIDQFQSEARPDQPPFFQRYYLDLIFLVIGSLVWWELTTRGLVIASTREGENSADITLLFSPAIFLLVVSLLFMRLFPILAQIVAIIGARLPSVEVTLGLWRLRRSPYWYVWPVLLLVLVSGLGVVSGTLASTLARSTEEQILYESGADFRFIPNTAPSSEVVAQSREIDGVINATEAFRASGRFGTTSLGFPFNLLAVDSHRFAETAWFRDDFSETEFQELTSKIAVDVKPEPIHLPADTIKLGTWAKSEPRVENLFLWLVIKDAKGRSRTVTLGQIESEWTHQTAEMSSPLTNSAELVSVQTFMQAGPDGAVPTVAYFDDVYAENSLGERTVLVDFDQFGEWTGMPTSNGLDVIFGIDDEPPGLTVEVPGDAGASVARVEMDRGNDQGVRGIYRTATGEPLPVIASDVFQFQTNTGVGSQFIVQINGGYVPVEIKDTVAFFPTLDPDRAPFLVANVDSTIDFLELRGLTAQRANEVFVSIDPDMHDSVLREMRDLLGFSTYTDRASLLEASTVDPLVVAGWRGISIVSIVMAGIAAAFGYLTYLAAHEVRTRRESALLSAMGMKTTSFGRLVMIEHALVALLGIGIGVVSGWYVSRIAVSSLTFTQSGGELLPPFVMQTNWIPVAALATVIIGSTLIAVYRIMRQYRLLPIHELTRDAN